MSRRRFVSFAAIVAIVTLVTILIASPTGAQKIARISDVLDIRSDAHVTAILPDVKGFLQGLREGESMRAFFDSPLGLHFLKSAPLRGAAHLHRLVALAPKSWQWNLYAMISDGPVLYRSAGKHFTLFVKLNAKGKILTSLMPLAHAQKVEDWFVIASDIETLGAAAEYLRKPVSVESPLDSKLNQANTLSLLVHPQQRSVSLTRALLSEFTGIELGASCILSFSPVANSIGIEGQCTAKSVLATATKTEQIATTTYSAYAYYRRATDKVARIIAVEGLTADYGYLIPRMFYSGPATDSKSIEYLSQAFKTRNHTVENKNGALQILYPRSYASKNNKYEIFSPILSANSDRFYWHSVGITNKKQNGNLTINSDYTWYLSVAPYQLVKNSQEALKQFDPIYSPGHFHEFRDALLKSLPTLKTTTFTVFAKPAGSILKIGGTLQFAEN